MIWVSVMLKVELFPEKTTSAETISQVETWRFCSKDVNSLAEVLKAIGLARRDLATTAQEVNNR